ncbi:MAG TPA: carboxypeptidase [Xanthobacteraceae bacterium]|nr:carboxypeptidase [Xanthobacteraceae bacterium]
MIFRRLCVAAFVVCFASAGLAQRASRSPAPAAKQEQKNDAGPGVLRLLPSDSTTRHSVTLADGKSFAYTATAGTLPLYDQSGAQTASVFFTAYVADGEQGSKRPITFAFNGGPGAASAYLHLGVVGPKILDFGAHYDAATAQLRDNPQTWLEFTDLVLIDPIGTGWSRTAKSDDASKFFSVDSDAEFFAKVIALYIAKNSRSASEKYLLGESYGGFRAPKVARKLLQDQGVSINGIVMVSPMLEPQLTFGGERLVLSAALRLPSLAAAQLERTHSMSSQAIGEAERFAMHEYLTTLAGPAPQGEAARSFYSRVAAMAGVPEDVAAKSRGVIPNEALKQLRSAAGKIASIYDGSFAVDDPFPERAGERGPDPVLDGFTRAYAGAFVGYARDQLGFKTDMTYVLLSPEISRKWQWRDGHRDQISVSDDLRILLAQNPSFRLVIAHGYSDLVTPYMDSRYVIEHLPPFEGPQRVQLPLYSGGHMFYVADDSRKRFTADMKLFFTRGSRS